MDDQIGRVQLPRRRSEILDQIRQGDNASARERRDRTERPSQAHMARAAIKRSTPDGNRVELDESHFKLLEIVAGITKEHLSAFERAGMPVQDPSSWRSLNKALSDLSFYYRSDENRISELLSMRDDLRCESP